MQDAAIPVYDLYGEAHTGALSGTLHVERIEARAPTHAWTILAHRHASLAQLFVIETGGGVVDVDGKALPFAAPCLIWLPAGCVHGFRFEPGADGAVVTAAADFLAEAAGFAPEIAPRLHAAAVVALEDGQASAEVGALVAALEREASAARAAGRSAKLLRLGLLLILLARAAAPVQPLRQSAAQRLTQAFRQQVERRYRSRQALPGYARALAISADRLHDAVRAVTGQTPGAIIHERIMSEARRALIYTSQPVSAIAYDLGFEDAAYFSRFFARRAGMSPSGFRAAAARA